MYYYYMYFVIFDDGKVWVYIEAFSWMMVLAWLASVVQLDELAVANSETTRPEAHLWQNIRKSFHNSNWSPHSNIPQVLQPPSRDGSCSSSYTYPPTSPRPSDPPPVETASLQPARASPPSGSETNPPRTPPPAPPSTVSESPPRPVLRSRRASTRSAARAAGPAVPAGPACRR